MYFFILILYTNGAKQNWDRLDMLNVGDHSVYTPWNKAEGS
jgi:hypothetical protein